MTAMVQEFDGVRELSMEEVDAVAGGPFWFIGAAAVVGTWALYTYGESFADGYVEGATGQEPTPAGE